MDLLKKLIQSNLSHYVDGVDEQTVKVGYNEGVEIHNLQVKKDFINSLLEKAGVDARLELGHVGKLRLVYTALPGILTVQINELDLRVRPNFTGTALRKVRDSFVELKKGLTASEEPSPISFPGFYGSLPPGTGLYPTSAAPSAAVPFSFYPVAYRPAISPTAAWGGATTAAGGGGASAAAAASFPPRSYSPAAVVAAPLGYPPGAVLVCPPSLASGTNETAGTLFFPMISQQFQNADLHNTPSRRLPPCHLPQPPGVVQRARYVQQRPVSPLYYDQQQQQIVCFPVLEEAGRRKEERGESFLYAPDLPRVAVSSRYTEAISSGGGGGGGGGGAVAAAMSRAAAAAAGSSAAMLEKAKAIPLGWMQRVEDFFNSCAVAVDRAIAPAETNFSQQLFPASALPSFLTSPSIERAHYHETYPGQQHRVLPAAAAEGAIGAAAALSPQPQLQQRFAAGAVSERKSRGSVAVGGGQETLPSSFPLDYDALACYNRNCTAAAHPRYIACPSSNAASAAGSRPCAPYAASPLLADVHAAISPTAEQLYPAAAAASPVISAYDTAPPQAVAIPASAAVPTAGGVPAAFAGVAAAGERGRRVQGRAVFPRAPAGVSSAAGGGQLSHAAETAATAGGSRGGRWRSGFPPAAEGAAASRRAAGEARNTAASMDPHQEEEAAAAAAREAALSQQLRRQQLIGPRAAARAGVQHIIRPFQ